MSSRVTLVGIVSLLLFAGCTRMSPDRLNVDFSSWTQTNPHAITANLPGHGSGTRNIFINEAGQLVTTSIRDNRLVWNYPVGTVLLKTVTSRDGSMVLGMIKEPDNRQSRGGWLWLTRDPVTGEERAFDTEYCVSCHADANEVRRASDRVPVGIPNPDREFRDFVFYPYYTD